MIYIIIIGNVIHSVWNSKFDAEAQKKVLKSKEFRSPITIGEILGTIPENGQYYI